jgi:hypothetical protein
MIKHVVGDVWETADGKRGLTVTRIAPGNVYFIWHKLDGRVIDSPKVGFIEKEVAQAYFTETHRMRKVEMW